MLEGGIAHRATQAQGGVADTELGVADAIAQAARVFLQPTGIMTTGHDQEGVVAQARGGFIAGQLLQLAAGGIDQVFEFGVAEAIVQGGGIAHLDQQRATVDT